MRSTSVRDHFKAIRQTSALGTPASLALDRARGNARANRPLAGTTTDRIDIEGRILRTRAADGTRLTFAVTTERDEDHGKPWETEDGHGPVSEWTDRPKLAGELVLATGRHGMKRFYDFAAACQQARAEGWNAYPYQVAGETPRQQAARAAMADYERLRAWCRDEWEYVGVVVFKVDRDAAVTECVDPAMIAARGEHWSKPHVSLWGIESDAGAYFEDVLSELLEQARTECA